MVARSRFSQAQIGVGALDYYSVGWLRGAEIVPDVRPFAPKWYWRGGARLNEFAWFLQGRVVISNWPSLAKVDQGVVKLDCPAKPAYPLALTVARLGGTPDYESI
jgi:hypothetical protein